MSSGQIKDDVYARLKESAEAYARLKGFSLEVKETGNNIKDLNQIIEFLNTRTEGLERINLRTEEYNENPDRLFLTHDKLIPETGMMIAIEFEPTYQLRNEIGKTLRRFLFTLCDLSYINNIKDTPTYDMLSSDMEENNETPESDDEEESPDYYFFYDYENEKGTAFNRFKEVNESLREKKFSVSEILGLKAEDEKEQAIIDLMKEGIEYIESPININEYRDTPFQEDEDQICTSIDDTIVLAYSTDDALFENIYGWIESSYQCTGLSETLCQTTEIHPELKDTDFDDRIERFVKYLVKIIETL